MFAWYYKLRGKRVPYYARYSFWLVLWKPIRKFLNVAIIPNIPFNGLRVVLYRMVGFKIGKKTFIGMKCYMDDVDPSLTTIGDNVIISYCCKFAVHGRKQKHTPLVIEDNAYIGLGSIIVSGKEGLKIGKNSVVGGGSLVISSVPSNALVAGNPAKVIRIEQ